MRVVVGIVFILAVASGAGGEDFTWSWQGTDSRSGGTAEESAPVQSAVSESVQAGVPVAAQAQDPVLEWKWQDGQVSGQPAPQRAASSFPTIEPTIDREQRELRKRADRLDAENQTLREQNARLQARVVEQESKLRQMGDTLRSLETRVMRAPSPERAEELERRFSDSEQKRLGLVTRLAEVQAGLAALTEEKNQLQKTDTERSAKSMEMTANYDGLLKENLDLRKQIADMSVSHQDITNTSSRLAGQVKGLEGQVSELASVIASLEQAKRALPTHEQLKDVEARFGEVAQQKDDLATRLEEAEKRAAEIEKNKTVLEQRLLEISVVMEQMEAEGTGMARPARVKELETRLDESELTRKALMYEIDTLQKKTAARKEEQDKNVESLRNEITEQIQAELAAKQPPSPAPGSDLFSDLSRSTIELKARIHDLTEERNKLAEHNTNLTMRCEDAELQIGQIVEKSAKLEQESEALRTDLQSTKSMLPTLQEEVARLRGEVFVKDKSLEDAKRDIAMLKSEVELRDHRLVKMEKMSAVMDRARDDVKQLVDKQSRDVHYNMAVAHARDGRYRDAEREYLAALSSDPSDADSHYNLGILYDEELADKKRAATHYRQYLKLMPYAADAENVRSWLMKLDLDVKR